MRFSVVIPAHNVESFIGRAVSSVLSQDFDDTELLVVADSCTDGTINEIEKRGVSPLIISVGSAGLARNVGLERAQGEYVLFLDGDDYYISDRVFTRLDRALDDSHSPDILHFGFMMGRHPKGVLSNGGHMWPNVWSRAWKRSAIGRTRFNSLRSGQDLYFCQDMFAKDGLSSAVLEELLIQYRYPREGSLTWERLNGMAPARAS